MEDSETRLKLTEAKFGDTLKEAIKQRLVKEGATKWDTHRLAPHQEKLWGFDELYEWDLTNRYTIRIFMGNNQDLQPRITLKSYQ